MARFKNIDWVVKPDKIHRDAAANVTEAKLAVLMDIRDELQTLNGILGCVNFLNIPKVLAAIKVNTAKPHRRKK